MRCAKYGQYPKCAMLGGCAGDTHNMALTYLILHLKVFPFPPGLAGRNFPLQTQLFQDGPMAQRYADFTHELLQVVGINIYCMLLYRCKDLNVCVCMCNCLLVLTGLPISQSWRISLSSEKWVVGHAQLHESDEFFIWHLKHTHTHK